MKVQLFLLNFFCLGGPSAPRNRGSETNDFDQNGWDGTYGYTGDYFLYGTLLEGKNSCVVCGVLVN